MCCYTWAALEAYSQLRIHILSTRFSPCPFFNLLFGFISDSSSGMFSSLSPWSTLSWVQLSRIGSLDTAKIHIQILQELHCNFYIIKLQTHKCYIFLLKIINWIKSGNIERAYIPRREFNEGFSIASITWGSKLYRSNHIWRHKI